MDELDEKILKILEKNARTPFLEIGKLLGVSEATIRNRVKKMVKEGIIEKFTIVKGEKRLSAFIFIQVSSSTPTSKISSQVKKIEGVKEVYEISGEHDVICKIEGKDVEEMNKVIEGIRKLPGVTRTITYFVLKR